MPTFRKVERAKVIIQDGQELSLKNCAKCQTEFYGDVKQTKCEDCRKRRKKVRALIIIGLSGLLCPVLGSTQQLEHAPTVEQCQADQKLWLKEMAQTTEQSFTTLGQRFDEMRQCMELDPTHNNLYYNTGGQALYQRELRLQHFLVRKNLYDDFLAEDMAGGR